VENSQKPSIVFFGNEQIATGTQNNFSMLKSLVDEKYEISGVILNRSTIQSRTKKIPKIEQLASELEIPVHFDISHDELKAILSDQKPAIGILVAYGKIIPRKILDMFPKGIINLHPSLLPAHRGSIPIESVILSGEQKTGVSVMKLAEKMDAGPIYKQAIIQLSGAETKQELADSALKLGSQLILDVLPKILDDKINPTEQNQADISYDKPLEKSDGIIDWSKSAEILEREIRAYAGWPRSRSQIGKIDLTISQAAVVDITGKIGDSKIQYGRLIVHCGSKSLSLIRLQPNGKKDMSIDEFLRGYSSKLNLS